MILQPTGPKRGFLHELIGSGFAGLIGAHEVATMKPDPGADAEMTVPFILASIGTLAFVAAGVLAFRQLRRGSR